MPYIRRERRVIYFDTEIKVLRSRIQTTGELNYVITKLALGLINEDSGYAELSAIRAVFHDAADEFYRRIIVPYEEQKQHDNGEVYDLDYDEDVAYEIEGGER